MRLLRQTFDWSQIEVAPGSYDFSVYDSFVGRRRPRRHHGPPDPVPRRPPSGPASPRPWPIPPTKYADLGDFGAVVVKRYGPNGTFWNDNPSIPKLPIKAVQLWNEPNLKAYWGGKPDAKQYTALLKASYKPIKAADPEHRDRHRRHAPEQDRRKLKKFIPAMYKAGAKKWFDTLAINPYGRTANAVIKNIERVRTSCASTTTARGSGPPSSAGRTPAREARSGSGRRGRPRRSTSS